VLFRSQVRWLLLRIDEVGVVSGRHVSKGLDMQIPRVHKAILRH